MPFLFGYGEHRYIISLDRDAGENLINSFCDICHNGEELVGISPRRPLRGGQQGIQPAFPDG